MGKVYANGLGFHVNRFRTGAPGERPVVVCVHGLAVVDNAAPTFLIGFHLATDAEVIAYDLRGHGRSDKPRSGYRIEDHATDLFALVDALEITAPVHLVAFSYGGAIAMAAALRHPERLASVTLLDGAVPIEGWEHKVVGMIERYEVWVREGEARGLTLDEMKQTVVRDVMEEYGVTRRRAVGTATRVVELFHSTTLGDDLRSEQTFGKEDFTRLTCPVMGVYGDKSDLYSLMDVLPTLIPDIRLHTISGADHLDVFWRVDELRPLLRDFIGLPLIGATEGPAT